MRVVLRQKTSVFRPYVFAPVLGVTEKELLRLRVAFRLLRRCNALFCQVFQQSHVGQTDPAVIRRILTERQLSIKLYAGDRTKAPVLADRALS